MQPVGGAITQFNNALLYTLFEQADEFREQLLSQAGIGPSRIVEFTCGMCLLYIHGV